jgi:hypothetical protein
MLLLTQSQPRSGPRFRGHGAFEASARAAISNWKDNRFPKRGLCQGLKFGRWLAFLFSATGVAAGTERAVSESHFESGAWFRATLWRAA